MPIRRATVIDAPAVAELWLRSRRASVPANPPTVHTDDEVRAHFTDEVLPTQETWVTEGEGVIVALIVLTDGWVEHLHVDPDHTGQGLGSSLLEMAKARQPGGLQLWTFQSNAGARRFYARHGFVEVQETDGDNEEGAPDVRLEWAPG